LPLSKASAKLELIQKFTMQRQPKTSEGSNSQKAQGLKINCKLQRACFSLVQSGSSFLLRMSQA
jgi:hypothetical protein